ncbi:MAG: hypothetical protein GY765_36175 [bacterium]|nr:hypothetical protein [bacterium]
MCFAFISIGGLEGDSRPVFSIQPAGVQVLPGETFTVSLYLDPANYGMKGANVVLKFNPTLLKARSITDGELGNEGTAKRRGLSLLNNNKGIIRIQVKKKPPLKPPLKPGAISDITFQVPAGTPMGSCDVTIFKAVFRTDSGRKIEDTVKEHLTVNIVAFKKAKILMNRFTKIPKKISGLQVYPSKLREGAVKLSQHNTEAVFKDFIGKNRQLLKIQPENLEMKPSRMLNKNRLVKFRQLYKGIPVYHSSVSMTAGESGKLLSYDTNYHTGITVPVKPKIAFKKALKIAAKSFRGLKVKSLRRKKSDTSASKLIIYPDKKNKTYHLAWHFLFSGSRPNPDVDTYFIIDAVKGNILHSYKRYSPARISGTLKGDIYPVNPTAPAVAARPLAHAYVEIPGSARKTTNSSGYFNSDSISSGTKTVTFNLEGPYAHVQDNGGVDFTTTKGCSGGSSCNFTWTAADEDGLNVFYHINVLRNWYRDWIGYTWVNHWTNTAQFRAEVNRRFDNAYAGDPMLFGINAYARSSDIIYHECSHNVLYKLYGDWVGFSVGSFIEGYAFDEGFADYFA